MRHNSSNSAKNVSPNKANDAEHAKQDERIDHVDYADRPMHADNADRPSMLTMAGATNTYGSAALATGTYIAAGATNTYVATILSLRDKKFVPIRYKSLYLVGTLFSRAKFYSFRHQNRI